MPPLTYAPGFDNPFNSPGNGFAIGTRKVGDARIRQYANELGYQETYTLLNALIGAAPGVVATSIRNRVKHSNFDQSGRIVTEGLTNVNRATTAADVTALKALVASVRRAPLVYPRDLSGNGGPAFTPG